MQARPLAFFTFFPFLSEIQNDPSRGGVWREGVELNWVGEEGTGAAIWVVGREVEDSHHRISTGKEIYKDAYFFLMAVRRSLTGKVPTDVSIARPPIPPTTQSCASQPSGK